MTKMKSLVLLIFLIFFFSPIAFAHHPAEDMVDEEIYAEIDLMVADTPHADMVFEDDDEMVIAIDDVGSADDLIADGLLDDISLLDGEVTITITFPEEVEASSLLKSVEELSGGSGKGDYNNKKWSEWGRPVEIYILQKK